MEIKLTIAVKDEVRFLDGYCKLYGYQGTKDEGGKIETKQEFVSKRIEEKIKEILLRHEQDEVTRIESEKVTPIEVTATIT